MQRRIPIRLGLLAGSLALLGALRPLPAAEITPLTLAPCRLPQAQHLLEVVADCGRLSVPENRSLAGGRHIELFVARLPAVSRRHRPDPLFVIAGGPGLGASDFFPSVAPAFARIRRDRDIVLVDQRGTGRSNPLNCAVDETTLWDAAEDEVAAAMVACRRQLAVSSDVAQYTTSVAVADLDAVRAALGYERINLYGSSYGTRVAQHYLRRYPAHARAAILDGVVAPQLVLGPSAPLDAQRALERILARCHGDAACRAQFGDPREDLTALRSQLQRRAVEIAMPDPRSGQPMKIEFTSSALGTALRLASYSADQAALLPLSLHLARAQGYFQPLAAQFLLATTTYGELLSYGMHNSVVCSEDVPYFAGRVDRPALEKTYLGTAQVDALTALCAQWPRGPVDPDLHDALHSDVPALLLSGAADPVTPASQGALAARGFRHALHVVLADQGHGQLVAPCMDRVMAAFLDAAATPEGVATLDHRCVDVVKAPPFFLTLTGPGP